MTTQPPPLQVTIKQEDHMTVTNDRAIIPLSERLLVTVEDAAQLASIGYSTMRKLVANGEIKSIKRGSIRRVIVASLKEWIAQNPAE